MSSLSIECIEIFCLRLSFFSQCSILSLGSLQFRISFNLLNLCLLLSFSKMSLSFCSCFVDNLDNFSLDLWRNRILLSFYLSDKHCSNLFSLHYGDFLSGLRSHFGLVLLDLCSINMGLQVHHLPVIFTLHIRHLLSLLIFQCQFLVTVLLYMIL